MSPTMTKASRLAAQADGRRQLVKAIASIMPTLDPEKSLPDRRVARCLMELCDALDDRGIELPDGRRTA